MNRAGQRTDHEGVGRCFLHGGKSVVKTGRYSKVERAKLSERIQEIKNSPDLLSLDDSIAFMRAFVEKQIEKVAVEFDVWEQVQGMMDGMTEDADAPRIDSSLFPKMDMGAIETLGRLINTAYNMRFSKRFSIPIAELETIMRQIAEAFRDVAARYNISNEAQIAFADKLRNIRVSRPVDPQLMRAGGDNTLYLEGEAREVS